MAHGPVPKKPENRVNRHRPMRGEWVTLPAEQFTGPRPALPRVRGGLLASTKSTWLNWWSSPMAHMWAAADWNRLTQAILLQDRIDRRLRSGDVRGVAALIGQQRLLLDGLGLTEKGRRDLRWQLPSGEEPELAVVTSITAKRRPDPRRK